MIRLIFYYKLVSEKSLTTWRIRIRHCIIFPLRYYYRRFHYWTIKKFLELKKKRCYRPKQYFTRMKSGQIYPMKNFACKISYTVLKINKTVCNMNSKKKKLKVFMQEKIPRVQFQDLKSQSKFIF